MTLSPTPGTAVHCAVNPEFAGDVFEEILGETVPIVTLNRRRESYAQRIVQLSIADPNYPGNVNRQISYNGMKFDPYSTAQNQKEMGQDAGWECQSIKVRSILASNDAVGSTFCETS